MIKALKFFVKEAALRVKYMTTDQCIFCKIISGEIKKDFVAKTEKVVAFEDINPVASTHILILPRRHIESILAVGEADGNDLVAMFKVAQKIVTDKNLDAFRIAFNGGKYQHVPHLHMHLLAGGSIKWSKL